MWNPWNWVKGGWDFAFGSVKQLYQWVLTMVAQLYDYVNSWVQWLQDAINNAVNYAANLAFGMEQWAQSWFTYIVAWTTQTFAQMTAWVLGLVNNLWAWVQAAWEFAHWVYSYLYGLMQAWISQFVQWVLRNIWDPLYKMITGSFDYLMQWINFLLQYITHPELLADLIGAYLLKTWLVLAKRYAAPLIQWWMRNMMSLAGEFMDIIESVLSSIL